MDVPTTADAPNADDNTDDNRCQCHMLISTANNSAIDLAFLQQWDEFYTDFLQYVHLIGVLILSTMTAVSNAAPSTFPVNDDPKTAPAFPYELDK